MKIPLLVLSAQQIHDFAVFWSACWTLCVTLGVTLKAVLVEGMAAQEVDRRELQGAVAHVALGLLEYLGTVWKTLWSLCFHGAAGRRKLPSADSPGLQLLDFRAKVSGFLAVLADLPLVVFDLLALSLQLIDEVVFDHRQGGRGVVGKRLHD